MVLILPTGPNVLNAVASALNSAARAGVDTQVVLPSLRRRAFMIANETGVLTLKDVSQPVATTTVRGG